MDKYPDNHGKKYPDNWYELVYQVKARANNKCEGTGRYPYCEAENGKEHPEKKFTFKVVLTTAHMNHDLDDNSLDNLRSLCQRCHNDWDMPWAVNRARRERREALAAGQMELF